MWNLIVGFLAPNLIAVVQQPKFTPAIRATIMFAASVVGGVVTALLNDQFNFEDVLGSILIVGVSAITFYKGLWKPTGVATGIENATSKTPPKVEDLHPSDGPRMEPNPYQGRRKNEKGQIANGLIIAILAVILLILLLSLIGRV